MRALLNSALEGLEIPVKITEAASGFEALRCLPREPFDLIVTDINMPDINGLELVSFAKNNDAYRSIPLVIVPMRISPSLSNPRACGRSWWICSPAAC
jgi:two-component system chemotaxis response regulator CheY